MLRPVPASLISVIIHYINQYDNIHQFVWTSTYLIAVIIYFPTGLHINYNKLPMTSIQLLYGKLYDFINLYMDFHTQLQPCDGIWKSILLVVYNKCK
ncbi:hypothetical protein V1478_012221 [Vespula squamosa]|uniref:Uncharacterized protein n=1 Tax=Vespula squamosa TaxID=30214 RepID=A0ABD2AEU4_VESSQ